MLTIAYFGIMSLPDWIGNMFGVSGIVADAFTAIIFIALFFMVALFFKAERTLIVVISILLMGPLTALGWLPFYVWIVFGVYVAYAFSQRFKEGF